MGLHLLSVRIPWEALSHTHLVGHVRSQSGDHLFILTFRALGILHTVSASFRTITMLFTNQQLDSQCLMHTAGCMLARRR
jgi:hypothetical protein